LVTGTSVAVAVLLHALRNGSELGVPWSVVMTSTAVLIGLNDSLVRLPGTATHNSLARLAIHPRTRSGLSALVVAQALTLADAALTTLFWAVAAASACRIHWAESAAFLRRLRAGAGIAAVITLTGAAACWTGLFLTWERGGYFLGGFENNHMRDRQFDGFTQQYSDRWEFGWNMMTNWVDVSETGRERPLAVLAVLATGWLCVTLLRAPMPSSGRQRWTAPVVIGTLAVWAVPGVGMHAGPWVFLLGVALLGLAAVQRARGTG
jgi:hypothetical protein